MFDIALNDKQKEAVEITEGPVIVFAGAGTGKTRTLTQRVAYMIENGIRSNNILAITFTNKATNEMRERLNKILNEKIKGLTISTFHSLCARILRMDIEYLGYNRHFDILDDEDQLKIINEALNNLNIDKKKYSAKHMRKVINNCKCFALKANFKEEQRVFDEYERLMKEYNSLDFEDLLLKTLELFEKFPDVLDKYRYYYRYVLVDEFQDTNLIQYKIVKLLTLESRNLFVVGDDDQSIYSFRGTNYENIKLFKKDFPEFKMVILNENYRSTQTILDGANKLIKNNKDRENKELFSNIKGSQSDVIVQQMYDDRDEVDYVMTKIRELKKKGVDYSDIAILYRSSVVSRNFELALVQNNIPYKIYGGISYLRRREIKDLIAYLKLIVNHNDINSFKRIVNVPTRGIGDKTVDKIIEKKRELKISLFEAIYEMKDEFKTKYKALESFVITINELSEMLDNASFEELYDALIEKTNFLESIKDEEDEKERKENIDEFKSILVSIDNDGSIASRRDKLIAAFDEAILSDDKLQNQRQRQDGVTLSTVHSVKGLEFDTVFIVAFEDGIFPNLNSFEDIDIEEERRITYVACTRAKKHLFLLCAKKRMLYGRIQKNSQSLFLLEFIGTKSGDKKKDNFDFDISQIDNSGDDVKIEDFEEENNNPVYALGDFVNHIVYGDGIIVSLEEKAGSLIGQICFTSQGTIKSFDMSHPSIKKRRK